MFYDLKYIYSKKIKLSKYLSSCDHISVPPQVNGFTVMLSGQRATFSWERNLAYGNYILYYEIHNGAAEFYEETKVSLKRTINLYNAKTSFTVSNLAHGASYSATIYQKYLNLKGLSTGFSFPVGKYSLF